MAGEHDFAPLSERELQPLSEKRAFIYQSGGTYYAQTTDAIVPVADVLERMARELRASRAAMRALVEAEDVRDAAQRDNHTRRYADAVQEIVRTRTAIRALVAHVGAEGEGR